jgi:Zn-dependent peptidase ImmA (M78 family)/DNA-binding Xre family transcriptional regulator
MVPGAVLVIVLLGELMAETANRFMLAVVRQAKGWSQKDLAEAAGIDPAVVSKAENGLLDLSGSKLESVAGALGCPVELLTDGRHVEGVQPTCLHHRRRSSKLTVATKQRIEGLAHLTRLSVQGLLGGLELEPEIALEPMDIDIYEDPAEVARLMRARWRIVSGPVPNVISLLEAIGILVVIRPLGTTDQDAVSSWPHGVDQSPIMLLNTGLAPDRERFTAIHELGHMLMHRIPTDSMEAEADSFAAEFLAPAAEVGPDLAGLTTGDLARLLELKAKWGISVAALIRRAHDLDLISDRQYREFQIRINRLGWRRVEPAAGIKPELPRTVDRMIDVHLSEHGYSVDELAKIALMTPASFTRHYLPPTQTPRTVLRIVRDTP